MDPQFIRPQGDQIVKGTQVQRVATQTIADATPTNLSFDQEDTDELNAWASSPNPTRLTAPTAGWYTVWGYSFWSGSYVSYRTVEIFVNGSAVITSVLSSTQTVDIRGVVSGTIYLNASDYVEINVFQDGVGSRTVTGMGGMLRHN